LIVLALTTSTPIASVALVSGDRVLAEVAHGDPRGHAERLFDLVDRALAEAGLTRADVALVACDVGPGSFTGVRIGVASAKGIAEGLGVPLAGVVSLDAMAAEARAACPEHALVAAAIDAKKDELYLAVSDGESELVAPCHVPRGDVAERVLAAVRGRPFVSVADVEEIAAFAPSAARALVRAPSAGWIGRLAALRVPAGGLSRAPAGEGALDPAGIVPLYVRAPDAVPQMLGQAPAFDMLPPR
jgi:tRNA threonylcarbamoyladenosine biosynthesis protein TsaB